MHHLPEIAIIEPNTLTALGLRTILEELIPEAVIRTFSSFEKLIDDTPDMYAHYFVSANLRYVQRLRQPRRDNGLWPHCGPQRRRAC